MMLTNLTVILLVRFGQAVSIWPKKRKRINARMPEPNDNFSMTVGNKVIVDAVFRDTGLDDFLDGLKRN